MSKLRLKNKIMYILYSQDSLLAVQEIFFKRNGYGYVEDADKEKKS